MRSKPSSTNFATVTKEQWEQFEQDCKDNKVKSGGWCNSCQRYDCGHWVDESGGVYDHEPC